MKRTGTSLFILGAMLVTISGVAVAQQANKPEEKIPVLTEVQKLTMQTKIQALQIASQQAEPKALAEAISQLITQRQQAVTLAQQAAQEAYQTISVTCGDVYALNPQTLVCEKKK